MKTVRIMLLFVATFLVTLTDVLAQKELVISGGNTVSSFVCNNRRIYTWGSNIGSINNSPTKGLLGSGGTADYYSEPQLVKFPNNEEVNQVSSGSGAHFLALDCAGDVWAWGNNSYGQVGNGNEKQIVTAPTRVKAGALAGTKWDDGKGFLTNVDVVYAGNNWSFAILDDGRLVGWGANSRGENQYSDAYGALGDGTQVNRKTPVLVKTAAGKDLTGVIQVFAGDNASYALVDTDGDGVGTMYSWGQGVNGILGRNAAGTANPNAAGTVQSSWAKPVYYYDEKTGKSRVMDDIVAITCGDVFAAALDVNGYIWSWGNGGWNSATGTLPASTTTSIPRKVHKGSTVGASNDGEFLLARSIGGGQGYGMAVTIDGKPVAWGGGGPTDGGGFNGGSKDGPEYITYAGTDVHDDVILINRGDTWGFYGRSDGSMWAWGANQFGQLGVGGVTSAEVKSATKINPPTGCGMKDPQPFVLLTPGDTTVCESSFTGLDLNSGFSISAALAKGYETRWYKDGVLQEKGTGNSVVDFKATTTGTYRVEVEYIGNNAGCSEYDIEFMEMTIEAFPQTFTVPKNLEYCGTEAEVNVNSTLSTNPIYTWYATAAGDEVIGTSIGSGSTTIDVTNATPGSGSDKIVFVEETSTAAGMILTKSQFGNPTDGDDFEGKSDPDGALCTGFYVSEQVTITELSYVAKTTIQEWQNGNSTEKVPATGSVDVTFGIYGAKKINNDLGADRSNLIGTMTHTYSRTRGKGDPQDLLENITLTGNVTLPPGNYFIGVKQVTSSPVFGNFKICKSNGKLPSGIVDDVTGTIITQSIGVANGWGGNQGSTGSIYDVKFSSGQAFCDRIPVTLKENCPCNTPEDFELQADKLTICPGESATLTQVDFKQKAPLTQKDFSYTWYKGSDIVNGPTIGTSATYSPSYEVSYADAGLYTLKIVDKLEPTSTCWKEVSITIKTAEVPKYTITGGDEVCEGTAPTPVTVNFTAGEKPFSITSTGEGAGIHADIDANSYVLQLPPDVVDSYDYTLTAISDKYCTGVATNASKNITINALPKAEIDASATEYCGNTSTISLGLTPATGVSLTSATYQWKKDGANFAKTASLSNVKEGTYSCVITLKGCSHTTKEVVIKQHDLPTYTITGAGSYCPLDSKKPVKITFTLDEGASPVSFDFQDKGLGEGLSSTGTYSVSDPKEGIYHPINIVDNNGCTAAANAASVEIEFFETPKFSISNPTSICDGAATTIDVKPGVSQDLGTIAWTVDKGSVNNSGVVSLSGTGTYTVSGVLTAASGGCTAPASAEFEVWENPTAAISPNPAEVCASVDLELLANPSGGSGTYDKFTWAGAGASNLNNKALEKPKFKNSTASNYVLLVEVIDDRGCKGTDDITVKVLPLPTATLPVLADVCGNESEVSITAIPSTTGTGTWSSNVINKTNAIADFDPVAEGEGTHTIEYDFVDSKGCVMATTVSTTIKVNPIPEAPVVKDLQYCLDVTSSALTATGKDLLWYNSATAGVGSSTAPIPPTNVAPATLEYWVTQTVDGCESPRAKITVEINDELHPVITSTPSFEECIGTSIGLSLTGGPFKTQTWTGDVAPLGTGTSLAAPTFAATATAGTYNITVNVEDDLGCTGTATETITINPLPTATINTASPYCEYEPVSTITAVPSGTVGTATWSSNVANTTNITAEFDPSTAAATEVITYSFVDDKGCEMATPAEISVVTNPRPKLSISYAAYDDATGICDYAVAIPVTLSPTGGTFSTMTGLDATTGEFDPKAAGAGTHTITYDYTDPTTKCSGLSVTTSITVNPRPVIDISMNDDDMCDYSPEYTLQATVDGTVNVTGTFAGSGVTSGKFNPTAAGKGTHTIKYNYTNPTTTCVAKEVSHDIVVNHTEAPIAVSAGSINTAVATPGPAPKISATGSDISAIIKWYAVDDTTSTIIATGKDYVTPYVDGDAPDNGFMKAGSYPMYATQTLNSCQSEPVLVTLNISKCPVPAPQVVNYHACVGDAALDLTATPKTRTLNGTNDGDLGWWLDQASIPTSPTLTDEDFLGATWNAHGHIAAGTYTVFVAEYYAAGSCYGPAAAVQIEVHKLPDPKIDDPGVICSTSGDITISTSAGGATTILSGTGVTLPNKWTPQYDATNTGVTTTTLTLAAEKTWGVAPNITATCANSVTKGVNVTHVLSPTGIGIDSDVIWSVLDIENVTAMDIQYFDAEATLSIEDSIGSFLTPEPVDMYTDATGPVIGEGVFNFDVWQTLNGCPSPKVVSTYRIMDCPTLSPNPSTPDICFDDALPIILGNAPTEVTPKITGWEWKDSTGSVISGTDKLDLKTITGYSAPGLHKFTVSFEDDDLASGVCRGPEANVTLRINPEPKFTIGLSKTTELCYDDSDLEISTTATGSNNITSVAYDIDGDAAKVIPSGLLGYVNPDGTEIGLVAGVDYGLHIYTINATVTDDKGCESKNSTPLKIQYTAPPTGTGIGTCVLHGISDIANLPEMNINYDATAGTTGEVIDSTLTIIGTESDNPLAMYSTHISAEGHYEYNVTQTVLGCKSQPSVSCWDVVDCPTPAPVPTPIEICEGEPLPTILSNATGQNIEWYDDLGAEIATTQDLEVSSLARTYGVGTHTFKVSQEDLDLSNNLCRGPNAAVTLTIHAKPDVSFDNPPTLLCYDGGPEEIQKITDNFGQGFDSEEWTLDGVSSDAIKGGVFDPTHAGEVSDTYTVGYSYTTGKGCKTEITHDVKVQFTPVPTADDYLGSTSLPTPIELNAYDLETGATVKWYDDAFKYITENNPFATAAHEDPATVFKNTYNVSQVVDGCESEKVEVISEVIACPVPAPVVSVKSPICIYDNAPEITATPNPVWLADGGRPSGDPEFRFYTSEIGGVAVESNISGLYTPAGPLVVGSNYLWVSEYNANVIPVGCEGPRERIAIITQEVAPPTIGSVFDICEGETNPEFVATGAGGTIEWYQEQPAPMPSVNTPKGTGESFTPDFTAEGVQTVYAAEKVGDCYSPATSGTYTIKPVPDQPIGTPSEICFGENNVPIVATPAEATSSINWYSAADKQTSLSKNSEGYLSTENSVGTYTYFAAQELNGCEGDATAVDFTIKPLPAAPSITDLDKLCDYSSNPTLKATGVAGVEEIRWYDVADVYITNVDTITHQLKPGTRTVTYKASQVVNGCEGDKGIESFMVIQKPSAPTANPLDKCEEDPVIPTFTSNLATTEWYNEKGGAMQYQGFNYTPIQSSIIGLENTYYMRVTSQGLCHSDTVPVILTVIPQPTFSIGESINACEYEDVKVITATDFSQTYKDEDIVEWVVTVNNNDFSYNDDTISIQPSDMFVGPGSYEVKSRYRYKIPNKNIYCSSDTIGISYTIYEKPRKPIVASTVICEGEEIEPLQAFGSPNVTWRTEDALPNVHTGLKYEFDPNQDLDTGVYNFDVVDYKQYINTPDLTLGCYSDTLKASLTLAPASRAKITGDFFVCEYENQVQYSTPYGRDSRYIWNVTGGNIAYNLSDGTQNNILQIDWSKPGFDTLTVYEITWANCVGSDTVVIRTSALPQVDFETSLPGASNTAHYKNLTFQDSIWDITPEGKFISEEVPYTMYWNFGQNAQSLDSTDLVVEYEDVDEVIEIGGYRHGYWDITATAINSYGCVGVAAQKTIYVDIPSSLYIPTAFAPTNAAHSVRYFQPKGFNLAVMEIWVFDTWGNLVWYSDEVEDGNFVGKWDGQYNGQMLKSDSYVWKINASFLDGQEWNGILDKQGKYRKYGNVILLR